MLNPFRTTDQTILLDTDMAGPLVFCLTLGSFLLLVSIHYLFGRSFWRWIFTHFQTNFPLFIRAERCTSHTFMASVYSVALHSMLYWRWWQHKRPLHWERSFQYLATVYCRWSYYPVSMCSLLYSKSKWIILRVRCLCRWAILIGIFSFFAEEPLALYWRPYAFCGVRFQHRNSLWPHTQWIINRFSLHIRALFCMVSLH